MIFSSYCQRCHSFVMAFFTILLVSCGGGGGGSSSSSLPSVSLVNPATGLNTIPVAVNQGITSNVNIPMVSVTVCLPGTTTCQTIDNVLLDTGSYGLRLFYNQFTQFNVPNANTVNGSSGDLTECVQFADGYTYGPVVNLDLKMNSELAQHIAVNVIASPSYTTIPSGCASGTNLQTPSSFGANGVLGVGDQLNDGTYGLYYLCNNSTCSQISSNSLSTFVVPNPVSQFAVDNNGVIVNLPALNSTTGDAQATGQLIFGINTQNNNVLPSTAFVLQPNSYNQFTTTLNSQTYTGSFIDSGSNGLYFNINLTQCTQKSGWPGFYCPNSTQSYTAQMSSTNTTTATVNFTIANPTNYPNGTYAHDNLAGTQLSGASYSNSFDWGLPFFFGKNVFVGIPGKTVSGGPTTPFTAFY